jgi:small-conductance mechanosensitive channel
LDDFYLSYLINAYTEVPAQIISELHGNIQDAFNEAGLEILSPHYKAARYENTMAVPAQYLPPTYLAIHLR